MARQKPAELALEPALKRPEQHVNPRTTGEKEKQLGERHGLRAEYTWSSQLSCQRTAGSRSSRDRSHGEPVVGGLYGRNVPSKVRMTAAP